MSNLDVVYPSDPHHQNYWAGQYSVMSIRGPIENYVLSVLRAIKLSISFIISVKDGISDENSYNEDMRKLKKTTDIQIVGALCTRNVNFKNILLLPLDDAIFSRGLRSVLSQMRNPPWEQKISKAFWRGGTSGGYPSSRTKAVAILSNHPFADVKLTFGDWNKNMPIPNEHFGDRCDLQKHFMYKYILIIDGNCIASNHQWVFGSGSVPIMITHPDNNYWFKEYLIPMVNYVPIKYDLSDLREKIQWLVANDGKAKMIMNNAMKFSDNFFSSQGQKEHIKNKIFSLVKEKMDIKLENKMKSEIDSKYLEKCKTPSDINEHLPTLLEYASKCDTIVECGVRDVCSSYSFAKGLKGKENNKFVMIDVHKSKFVEPFLGMCLEDNVNATFVTGSDLECELIETDLLFIDTWHIYGQLKRELARWNNSVKKYIVLHDTTTYEWKGEGHWCAEESSKTRNMPVDEIIKGLWYAVEEFLKENNDWKIEKRYTNNNGLTILARK